MGTIKCGFWKIKFILTPKEFSDLIEICQQNNILFHLPVYEYPIHDRELVLLNYQKYYNKLISINKPIENRYTFCYSLTFPPNKKLFGFHLLEEGLYYPYHGQWAEDKIPYLSLSYQKGFQINLEDEKGKYFIYEDIKLHQPEGYPIFEKITIFIKAITKPLRFMTFIKDDISEVINSPVRISENAAKELSQGWIFKEYKLEMKSYTKNNKKEDF